MPSRVALMGGEGGRARGAAHAFLAAGGATGPALVQRQTRLIGFTAGYGHISTVFPILVVSPAYLTGAITLGALIQAHLAFPARRGRVRVLHRRLSEDRRMEGDR